MQEVKRTQRSRKLVFSKLVLNNFDKPLGTILTTLPYCPHLIKA